MTKQVFKEVRKLLGFTLERFAQELGYATTQPIIRKEREESKPGSVPVSRQDEIIIEQKFPDVLEIVLSSSK